MKVFAPRIRKKISGLTGKSFSWHSWSLPLGLWVRTRYPADGHAHSVLAIRPASKIGALIVICSTTKRILAGWCSYFIVHASPEQGHFHILKASVTGAFHTGFTLSGRRAQAPVHEQSADWVSASCGCWLLSHFWDIFQRGSTLSSFHVDSSLSQAHKQPTGPTELHRL